MNARRLGVLLLSLAAAAGCSRGRPTPEPPAAAPIAASPELLVGKWQATGKSGQPLDWTFFDVDLSSGPPALRFTKDGKVIAYLVEDGEFGTKGPYRIVDGQLEVSGPGEKPTSRRFSIKISEDTLVLGDDAGNTQTFARARPVAGSVTIAQLPLCCAGCGIVLEEQLEKLPGVSALAIDVEKRTATLKLQDAEDIGKVRAALRQAGMEGQLSLDGKVFRTGGINYAGKPPGKIVLTDVHACCAACEENVTRLVKGDDVKVAFTGDGPRKTVTITGNNLDLNSVMTALGNAGYYFTVESP